ncbi:winged helix-turn-helix domain-containing protein [Streptomyces griseoincarnatus]
MDACRSRGLIAKLYRVRLTEQGVGVGKYLHRWGLSFQRPDNRAFERSASGGRGPGRRSARGRRPRAVRCSSPTMSASVPTRSPAAHGASRVHAGRAPHGQPVLSSRLCLARWAPGRSHVRHPQNPDSVRRPRRPHW